MPPPIEPFRAIAESAVDPIFVNDRNGCVLYANPAAERAFGYAAQEFTGTSLHDLIHHHLPDGKPYPREACPLLRACATGETVHELVETFVRKDGSFLTMAGTLAPAVLDGGQDATVFYLRDVTEHNRVQRSLTESEERFRLATELTNLGLWEFYTATGELVWDETTRRIYGMPTEGKVDYETFINRLHPDDRERVDRVARKSTVPGSTGRFFTEYRIIRANDGAERWLKVNGESLVDQDGHTRFVGTTLDITDIKLAEQRIRQASQRDTLTGLPNRALLFEYCEHLLAIAQRTRSNGALLFIDLDRFKPINDTHGHGVGDQVLKQVAKRLGECTRQEDIVGRLGGDEFVVALPHPDDVHGPATVARNIVERISEPYHIGELQLHLSPSIGISLYPRHGTDLDTLIKCADAAMYEAKKAGRKRYRFYSSAINHSADQQIQLELRLRDAVERGEFLLLYQPVMDVGSGATTGAEALLRLPMPDGVMLAPAQFLPTAEAAGLINRIGEWVAQEACSQHQKWRQAGLPEISIAINVAPQQFRQRSFIRYLADSVEHSGMDPSFLQIELKESSVLEDVSETISALEEIRAIGIRVALDDFGVGYSSVRLLSSLPIDALKIDQSFVSRIGHDAKSQVIADTVLALGRTLNLRVVGEGIESEDIFDYLRGHGCNQAQGYYFSGPLTPDEFVAWYHAAQPEHHVMH